MTHSDVTHSDVTLSVFWEGEACAWCSNRMTRIVAGTAHALGTTQIGRFAFACEAYDITQPETSLGETSGGMDFKVQTAHFPLSLCFTVPDSPLPIVAVFHSA
jgi:hypothetical protein